MATLGQILVKGNSKISFMGNSMWKEIDDFNRNYDFADISTLRSIYKLAQGQRVLSSLKRTQDSRAKKYEVELKTRGYHRLPSTEKELQKMIKDIVCGLYGST